MNSLSCLSQECTRYPFHPVSPLTHPSLLTSQNTKKRVYTWDFEFWNWFFSFLKSVCLLWSHVTKATALSGVRKWRLQCRNDRQVWGSRGAVHMARCNNKYMWGCKSVEAWMVKAKRWRETSVSESLGTDVTESAVGAVTHSLACLPFSCPYVSAHALFVLLILLFKKKTALLTSPSGHVNYIPMSWDSWNSIDLWISTQTASLKAFLLSVLLFWFLKWDFLVVSMIWHHWQGKKTLAVCILNPTGLVPITWSDKEKKRRVGWGMDHRRK